MSGIAPYLDLVLQCQNCTPAARVRHSLSQLIEGKLTPQGWMLPLIAEGDALTLHMHVATSICLQMLALWQLK